MLFLRPASETKLCLAGFHRTIRFRADLAAQFARGVARYLRVPKRGPLVFLEPLIRARRILRMRYVVTGGAGFIGSNTVDELVKRGHSVVVLDDLSAGKEENLAEIRSKITLIKGSITDIEVVRKAMHEAEYVLHLAARTSVPKSVKDPIESNRINIDG